MIPLALILVAAYLSVFFVSCSDADCSCTRITVCVEFERVGECDFPGPCWFVGDLNYEDNLRFTYPNCSGGNGSVTDRDPPFIHSYPAQPTEQCMQMFKKEGTINYQAVYGTCCNPEGSWRCQEASMPLTKPAVACNENGPLRLKLRVYRFPYPGCNS